MATLDLDKTYAHDQSYRGFLKEIFGEKTNTVQVPDQGALLVIDPIEETQDSIVFMVLWCKGILLQRVRRKNADAFSEYFTVDVLVNDNKNTYNLFVIDLTFTSASKEWQVWGYNRSTRARGWETVTTYTGNNRYVEVVFPLDLDYKKIGGVRCTVDSKDRARSTYSFGTRESDIRHRIYKNVERNRV